MAMLPGGLISSSSSGAGGMKPGPSSGSCDPGHRPGLPGDIPGRTVRPLRLISGTVAAYLTGSTPGPGQESGPPGRSLWPTQPRRQGSSRNPPGGKSALRASRAATERAANRFNEIKPLFFQRSTTIFNS